jgi:putative restriction endonuclease
MRAVVGVTDNAWAEFLRQRPHLTEANFWLPSSKVGFRALTPGEPFLFKTHWPDNQLVGGGFYSGFTQLSIAEAWDLFGEGNGVPSREALTRAIAGYRAEALDARARIGCVLLRDLFFVPGGETFDAPADFSPNIVRFKGYELQSPGNDIGQRLDLMLGRADLRLSEEAEATLRVEGPMFGLPRLTEPRLGQQAFKGMVLTSYGRRCAVTGSRIEPTLEAAHIRPVSESGAHRLDNGLLLRCDVHTLFDAGYLGIDDRYHLHVSKRLREDWSNGQEFYDRAGITIALPERRIDRPAREFVTWHMDTRFR